MEAEVQILKKKLSETEARLSSRMLNAAKGILSQQDFDKLKESFDTSSLDLLETERSIAADAKYQSELYKNIFEAAEAYKKASNDLSLYAKNLQHCDPSEWAEKAQYADEANTRVTIARQKLFSLLDEFHIKERFNKSVF